jgi:hypothetical protein
MRLTSEAEEALAFYQRCGRRAVLSSPSGRHLRRVVGGKAGAGEIEAALARHPIVLQEAPDGEWLQVFTVGERAFGARALVELPVGGDDQGPLRAVELPPAFQTQCCRLAGAFRLDFARLLLLQTERAEFYCLDLSSRPEYANCEEAVQQQITAALAARLMGGDKRCGDDPAAWRAGRPGDGVRLRAPVSQ